MPRPSRKNDLLDAGVAAVLNQGATQTTLESVCTEVGVTKGAFFHHFQDKDAFVSAMLQHFGDRGAASLAAVDLAIQPTALEHLQTYLGALGHIYGRDPWFRRGCLFLIVAQEYEDGSPIRRQCEQGLERWLKASTAEFRRIARRTGQRPLTSERQLAEQLLYTIEGALHVGRAREVTGSIRRALQQFERYARAALHIE
ncbi:TetR/AcrR family transcriptional regulator [Ideonella sp. A 288]|uniref:TetR/AcrR family transcriptional regulator n=1 Tax=Ideonella sp. A 288 TaxID=1962181 RepID=UPI001186C98B|nr:TetR/AcrR family transcriptional regulator [Ideonella sp. A 288]